MEFEAETRRRREVADLVGESMSDISALGRPEIASRASQAKARYAYYRKRKFREYADFVNNKYFLDNLSKYGNSVYALDPNYVKIDGGVSRGGEITYPNVLSSGPDGPFINDEMIQSVAKSLAVATMYIVRLREKLKLQTRKYYMKGTQNLLLYVINEYLIDYSRHKLMLSSDRGGAAVQDVLRQLSSHTFDQLEVMEYYDETEYYNQECDSTKRARNGQTAAQDFWTEYNLTSEDGLTYGLKEIQKFYLSAMSLGESLSDVDDLSAFLATVFANGADDAFFDRETGMFAARLSAHGGQYSCDIWPELARVSAAYVEYRSYAGLDQYSYDAGPLSDQISAAVWAYAAKNLSGMYLSAVSSLYEKYMPSSDALSSRIDSMKVDYDQAVSGDYMVYFLSSDCESSQA